MTTSTPGTAIAFTAPGVTKAGGGGAQAQRATAVLELFEPKVESGGVISVGASSGKLAFQFNPKEVTVAKSAKWNRKQAKGAKSAAPPEFSGAEPCKLTLEMFFDGTRKDSPSVVAAVEALFQCCVPSKGTADSKQPLPPLVKLQWGTITSFPAYVTQVSAKYTLFAPDGTPVRATCSVSLEEVRRDPPKTNPTSGAVTVSRVHTVVDGDSLASVAYCEYRDAALWRPLAAFNGIDDPMVLTRGQALLLPALEDLVPAPPSTSGSADR